MGGATSKQDEAVDNSSKRQGDDFVRRIRSSIEDEVARRMMVQREVQMAINIAKARDNIHIFGSAWVVLTAAAGTAHLVGRKPPPLVGVPIVVGAVLLGNLYDMAYGNKLMRVTKEAEYLLESDRGRFIPVKQAPFSKFYSEAERNEYYSQSAAVGDIYPNRLWSRQTSTERK